MDMVLWIIIVVGLLILFGVAIVASWENETRFIDDAVSIAVDSAWEQVGVGQLGLGHVDVLKRAEDKAKVGRVVVEAVQRKRRVSPLQRPFPTMSAVVSLIVLGCALFVILDKASGDAEKKWAFGVVGTILGYWLKR